MSIVLKAEVREQVGSLASKKIKRQGLIPAVIYSKEKNINISLNSRDFENQFFKGVTLTSVIDLEIGNKKTRVIAHKIDLDPVSDRPVHIDFMLCENNKPIRAKLKKVVFFISLQEVLKFFVKAKNQFHNSLKLMSVQCMLVINLELKI